MALYNGEHFLEPAVRSVVQQSYPHWELLIVDDGSTDGSLTAAHRLACLDRRIRVFTHEGGRNCGVSATRNLAIRHARGKYLAVLDCDDVWLPTKLEKQISVLRRHPEVVLTYGKAQVIDTSGDLLPEEQAPSGNTRPRVFGSGPPNEPVASFTRIFSHGMWVPASSSLFVRDASLECGNFTESLPGQVEDSYLFLRLAERGAVYFLNDVLIHYRLHTSQYNAKTPAAEKASNILIMLLRLAEAAKPENRQQILTEAIEKQFRSVASLCLSSNPKLLTLLRTVLSAWKSPKLPPSQKKRLIRIVWERVSNVSRRCLRSR